MMRRYTTLTTSTRWLLVFAATACLLLSAVVRVVSQSGGPHDIPWWSVDGGYSVSRGGDYSLAGTVGQPDAGLLTGGDFTLGGGFWGGGALPSEEGNEVYLPLVLRGHGSR
jgi:hypothetical protein